MAKSIHNTQVKQFPAEHMCELFFDTSIANNKYSS